MNLRIKLENTYVGNASCNFCSRGELSRNGMGLIYPYERVLGFGKLSGGGLYACICKDCLNEFYDTGMQLLNKDQNVQASVATESDSSTIAE